MRRIQLRCMWRFSVRLHKFEYEYKRVVQKFQVVNSCGEPVDLVIGAPEPGGTGSHIQAKSITRRAALVSWSSLLQCQYAMSNAKGTSPP